MSTLKVEMIDIHEWDAEESLEKRKELKENMRKEIEKSVRANDRKPRFIKGMLKTDVTDSRKHRCAASYVWYSVTQNKPNPSEKAYTDFTGWKYRAPSWAHLLATAKGESGGIESRKMKDLMGDDHKTLHPRIKEACQKDLVDFTQDQIKKTTGIVRPRL